MKKVVLMVSAILFSSYVFAKDASLSITPDKICQEAVNSNNLLLNQEYVTGDDSLFFKKYDGKIVKYTGKINVFNGVKDNDTTSPFMSVTIRFNNNEIQGYIRNANEKDEKTYLGLNGKLKTISVRIDYIAIAYENNSYACTVSGDLISYK